MPIANLAPTKIEAINGLDPGTLKKFDTGRNMTHYNRYTQRLDTDLEVLVHQTGDRIFATAYNALSDLITRDRPNDATEDQPRLGRKCENLQLLVDYFYEKYGQQIPPPRRPLVLNWHIWVQLARNSAVARKRCKQRTRANNAGLPVPDWQAFYLTQPNVARAALQTV